MSASPAVHGTVELDELGVLTPISRSGGQGRVYLPERTPEALMPAAVIKLYRHPPQPSAAAVLTQMVEWSERLAGEQRELLHRLAAWPLATISSRGALAGIAMQDLTGRFEVPFLMPSGRSANVLLQLEHLLGADDYLRQRGLSVTLDTVLRARVVERISAAFAFLHRHAIVVSDVSPSNLLISLSGPTPTVCLIDCDSMVFHGHQALVSVETGDWQMPPTFGEAPVSRAADAYKLALIVLRLFARSHDARALAPQARHVPEELHGLLARALSPDARNRPPAGEWQLALHRTLASTQLLRSRPGPRPAVARAPVAPQPPRHDRPPRARVAPAPPRRASTAAAAPIPVRASGSRRATRETANTFRGFTIAWLIAGALLLLVFAHLLESAAVPASSRIPGAESPASLQSEARYPRGAQTYEPAGGAVLPQEEGYGLERGAGER